MLRNLSNGFRWGLWPFSLLYSAVTRIRNDAYDRGLFVVYQSDIYTINVGNLTAGGTGKTPHIEYLVRLLEARYQVAVLSRGYGRKTTGFRQADDCSTAADIGDEPLQLCRKFGAQVPVFVCEKRAVGLQRIKQGFPHIQVVLLDDAFQHRAVAPRLNLLLSDYGRLFYNDHVLPMGRLRESVYGARRAQAVVITKCPPLSREHKKQLTEKIRRYTQADTPVFFSGFAYDTPVRYTASAVGEWSPSTPCWLVSGIAQPTVFEQAAGQYFSIAGHTALGDHHTFSEAEIRRLAALSHRYPILTTEKDWVKINPILIELALTDSRFYYWPVRVTFDGPGFDEFALSEAAKQCRV